MDTGCFYIFENRPVSIKEILAPVCGKDLVCIRHIQRVYDADGKLLPPQEEAVFADRLQKMTRKLAKQTIEKYNRRIGECNTVIHAIEECLQHM